MLLQKNRNSYDDLAPKSPIIQSNDSNQNISKRTFDSVLGHSVRKQLSPYVPQRTMNWPKSNPDYARS